MPSFADDPDSTDPDGTDSDSTDPDGTDSADDGVLHAFAAGHADPRTRRAALWALAVVVVLLVVTVSLVGLVDAGPGAPRSPTDAARRWFTDAAAGHTPTASTLCSGIASTAVPHGAHIVASTERRTAASRWVVTFTLDSGRRTVRLSVERHRNRYVVC